MASHLAVRITVDIQTLLPHVRVPTIVIHPRGDAALPASEGRRLAARSQLARFIADVDDEFESVTS